MTKESKPTVRSTTGESESTQTAKSRLEELVALVLGTARAKGWRASVDAEDAKTFRYATIAVERRAANNTITGNFELLCDERVKITYHRTSFHSYGLADLYEAIKNEFFKLPWVAKSDPLKSEQKTSEIALIERVLRRFHFLARQLRNRHDDRPGFEIRDEYDIQDLMHAVLRGLFDDVRPEEYTPSYAGGSSRMDFLLKSERIAIELKLANVRLKDKQIGEQLLIDIGRYQSHPDCRRLICFVYDPSGHLRNPAGLEADLSRTTDNLEVKVVVVSV